MQARKQVTAHCRKQWPKQEIIVLGDKISDTEDKHRYSEITTQTKGYGFFFLLHAYMSMKNQN